jgi:hypothetical protein
LKAVEDISRLPASLGIGKVCSGFMTNYLPNNDPNPIVEPGLLMNGQFMQNVASEYEDDNISAVSDRENKPSGLRPATLLRALLRTFGAEFFWLGLLKLLNDCLNFSGPLLLNQLVQFVESNGKYSSLYKEI